MEKSLAVVIKDSGVNDQSGVVIQSSFDVFLKQADTWKSVVESIVVTSSSQKKEMKLARTTRLALKDIRVAAKKRTTELKAEALKYNKAVQDAYNFIEETITPLEEQLFVQEKFAEIEAAALKIKLYEERNAEMVQYGSFAPHGIDYASLSEEEYITMKEGIEVSMAEKAEADRIAEEERLERLRLEEIARVEAERVKAEQARIEAENYAKLRAENERLRLEKKEIAEKVKKDLAEEKARVAATIDDVKQVPESSFKIDDTNSAYLGSGIYVVFNGTAYELKHGSTSSHAVIIMPDTAIIKLAEFSMRIIANG